MGLTIHYSLHARGGDAPARRLIQALHQAAQDLPFQHLGPIVDLSGDQCGFDHRGQDDPLRWLLIQACGSVDLEPNCSIRVAPRRLLAFTAWPGEGCESSNIGLCLYPATVDWQGRTLQTKLSGWRWNSFCKTNYASNPACGGLPHFLQCHLTVIALLDVARKLGCLAKVDDEGGFWEKRDLPALAEEVGSWNEMLAALGGRLKDMLGPGVTSEIARFPNFEALEAAGQTQLPAGFDELIPLLRRFAHPVPPTVPAVS